jgi:hypothetical protein
LIEIASIHSIQGEVSMAQYLYMDLAAHPQTILDSMDGMRLAIEKTERQQKLFKWLRYLPWLGVLIGLGMILMSFYPLVGFALISLSILSLFFLRPKTITAKSRFETAYLVIHTLRDDAGRKGRLVGHLDLSPPNQKTKLLRTGKTSRGRTKYYYRDPWFLARLKLADGSVVKLLLEDRVKEKKGSFVYHVTNWENKVMINPSLYEATGEYDPSRPSILTGFGQLDRKQPDVALMLEDLKSIFSRVRPLEAPTSLPSEGTPAEGQPHVNPPGSEAGISPEGAQPQ